jgi:FtsH-binding integral membrane protein
VQLLLTTATCAAFMTVHGLQSYMIKNTWPLWTSLGVSFGVMITMLCSVNLARTFPHNYILLTIFTLAESVMVGTICMVRLHFPKSLQTSTRGTTHTT